MRQLAAGPARAVRRLRLTFVRAESRRYTGVVRIHSLGVVMLQRRRILQPRVWAGVLAGACLAFAFPPSARAAGGHLTEAEKVALIRGIVAEIGVAKQPFPHGKNGIKLASTGQVLNEPEVRQTVTNDGPAVRPGDRVQITKISFDSHAIVLEINGGPTRSHWYNHLQIGMGATTTPVALERRSAGSVITLRFAQGIPPHLTPAQLKQMLAPIVEWNLRKAPVAALGHSLPPAIKQAIQNHQVLVGMNTDMVMAAKGRADEKYHETDPKTGDQYTDWIYGHPPADTTFVRLEGDRVIRVIDYKADGTKVVRVTPQVALPASSAAKAAANGDNGGAQQRPTLRRPGEVAPPSGRDAAGPGPIIIPGAPTPAPSVPGASGQPQMPPPLPQPGTPGAPTPPANKPPGGCCAV